MELQVNPVAIPERITFNYDELRQELAETLQRYEGMIYNPDQMKAAKADKAALNKLKKALNDERIRREREYMAPFLDFKAQIAELISLIEKPVALIDKQVKEYEEQKKAEKYQAISDLFEKDFAPQYPEWLKFEQIFVESWLNASCTMKTIRDDLTAMRNTIYSDLMEIHELPDYSFEALEVYKQTLSLKDAISEGKRLSEIQRRKEEQERLRKETEAARIAAENERRVAAEAAAGFPDDLEKQVDDLQNEYHEQVKPAGQWISFSAFLTVSQAKELRAFFEGRGIEFKAI